MRRLFVLVFTTVITIFFLTCFINAEHMDNKDTAERSSLKLSKKLRRLLSAEMNAVQHGMTNLSVAIPAGDWNSIAETARYIKDGYILDRKLSKNEMTEFLSSLPEGYNIIDREYKRLADEIINAAEKKDPDEVNITYFRLNGTCIECHVKYAKKRFPGFK